MVFCNIDGSVVVRFGQNVTILILIDGFLQWKELNGIRKGYYCHNPYFNRWFSAIICIYYT